MNRANLACGPWIERTIQNNAATIEVFHVYDRWNILQRMHRANLVRGQWTERTIYNNVATIEVFHVYNRWNILQSMNCTNLFREAWNERTIRKITATTNNVCFLSNRLSNLQRLNASNQIRLAWNKRTIQNIATTTPTLSPLILPDRFNQFLDLAQKGHSYSMDQIMSYEMKRLHSFKRDFPVSAIRLAQSGFFATGFVDEVKCFSCGVYYRNWQSADIPHLLHERMSPNCRLVDKVISYLSIK